MRVTEVRVRSFPKELSSCVDVTSKGRRLWMARLVVDRRMAEGVVTFRYERVVGRKTVVRAHSRSRTIL
jgi:hypothetical protein